MFDLKTKSIASFNCDYQRIRDLFSFNTCYFCFRLRSVKNSDGNNLLQTLEKCSDGEEICDVDVNKLLQLFNSL